MLCAPPCVRASQAFNSIYLVFFFGLCSLPKGLLFYDPEFRCVFISHSDVFFQHFAFTSPFLFTVTFSNSPSITKFKLGIVYTWRNCYDGIANMPLLAPDLGRDLPSPCRSAHPSRPLDHLSLFATFPRFSFQTLIRRL